MIDPLGWSCPLPLRDYPRITMAHGGGGQLGADLVRYLFLPAFGEAAQDADLADAAVLSGVGGQVAFTTDAHVVQPLFFPGGDIGTLAINGTVNDLAMVGAQPVALSTAFILEEGLELATLHRVAQSMGQAAHRAGVRLVTGDTKVVDAGHGDGIYITTAGVGLVPSGVRIAPDRATAGDKIIISGAIGRHGIAVLSQREGLTFGTTIESDCAPLNGVVSAMIGTGADIHVLRDLTRGGLAAALCELAEAGDVGIRIDEPLVPVPGPVRAACGFLGLDPFAVANEGTCVAFVPPDDADRVLEALQDQPEGAESTIIGEVVTDHRGTVVGRTAFGASRVLPRPLGEQLPRIC
jgi:hydrogenase expression/formation protein HypE